MAGEVAAAGEVVGALGETGGHAVGALQDAHRGLWRKGRAMGETEMGFGDGRYKKG